MARPRVRPRLLEAAVALWREQGPSALTTRAVAEKAGVTEASVFNNFADKGGLLRALIQEGLPEFPRLVALLEQPTTSLPSWLEQVFLAAIDYFTLVLPLAAQAFGRPGQAQGAHGEVHARLSQALAALPSPPDDPDTIALLLLGAAMHSATTRLTLGHSILGVADDEVARRVIKSLLSGQRFQH